MCNIRTVEYYAARKGSELRSSTCHDADESQRQDAEWKKQTYESKYCMTPFILNFQNCQIQRDREWIRVCQRLGDEGNGE